MQTLLQQIMPQYIRWHQEINVLWKRRLNSNSALADILTKAGCNVRGKTSIGLLLTPVDPGALERALTGTISRESQSHELDTAILLAGLLRLTGAIPALMRVVEEERYDSDSIRLTAKTLIMLDYEEKKLKQFLRDIVKKHADDEILKILYVRQLVVADTPAQAKRAFAIINSLQDDNIKSRSLLYLASIQKKGIDTSGMLPFILSDADPYFAPQVAEWARVVGTREVLEPILDSNRRGFSFHLLLSALSAPSRWTMLYPLLTEREQAWIDDDEEISTERGIAFLALLGALGHDVSSHVESGSLVVRYGAYLGMAVSSAPCDFDHALENESDGDVRYAIMLARLMRADDPSAKEEASVMTQYRRRGYGLKPISRRLVVGTSRAELLPEIQYEYLMATERNTKGIVDDHNSLSSVFDPQWWQNASNWADSIDGAFDGTSVFDFNSAMIAATRDQPGFGYLLSEAFLEFNNASASENLLLLAECRADRISSAAYDAMKHLHTHTSDSRPLTRPEFDAVFPYVFHDDDWYRERIIKASLPILASDPALALQIVRTVKMDPELNQDVLRTISATDGEPIAADIAAISDGRQPGLVDTMDIAVAYGDTQDMVFPVLNSVLSGQPDDTQTREKLNWLLKKMDDDSNDVMELVLAKTIQVLGVQETAEYINSAMSDAGWQSRRLFVQFMGAHPAREFMPIVFARLKDDDNDVRKAAIIAADELLTRLFPAIGSYWVNGATQRDDALEAMIEHIKKKTEHPQGYAEHLGVSYVLAPFRGDVDSVPPGDFLTRDQIRTLLLHMTVDFVDEASNRLVVHIQEKETSEVLAWFLEFGEVAFFTVQKA